MNNPKSFLRNKVFLGGVIVLLIATIALVSVKLFLPATQKAPQVQGPLPTPQTQVVPTTYSLEVQVGGGTQQEVPADVSPTGAEDVTATPTSAEIALAETTPTPTVEGLGGVSETTAPTAPPEDATATPVTDLPESGVVNYSTAFFVVAVIIMGLAFVL